MKTALSNLEHAAAQLSASQRAISRAGEARSLGEVVDELGTLKGQIAALQEEEKRLRAMLIDSGQAEIDGAAYRATVSESKRETRDDAFKARIEDLIEEHLSHQYITAHTGFTPVTTVRVVARRISR